MEEKVLKKYFKKAAGIMCIAVLLAGTVSGCKKKTENSESKPEKLKFDFGVDSNYTSDGWTAVTVNNKKSTDVTGYKYSKGKGYGFLGDDVITGRQENAMEAAGDELPQEIYSDYALAKGQTFVVDVDDGYYTVQMVVATISDSYTQINVEGVDTPNMGEAKKYTITTLENVQVKDGQMTFKISGTGTQGGLINAIAITQMNAPSGLKGEMNYGDKSVSLTWEAAEGAESYAVYRVDETGSETVFKGIKETTYKDSTVEKLSTYTYYVKGMTETGAESAATEEIIFSIIDGSVTAPLAPVGLKVDKLEKDSTTITWKEVENADIYAIYWSNIKGTEGSLKGYKLLAKTDKTSITNEASTFNPRYYKVLAGNDGGYSEYAMIKAESGMNLTVSLEYLDRGAVAIKTDAGVYVGFRVAIDEYGEGREFELYRDGKIIKTFNENDATNYVDKEGALTSVYTVKAVKDGKVLNETEDITVNEKDYYEILLQKPQAEKLPDNSTYTYSASDTALGDADGDGVYEYFVKWDPSNSKDNSKSGYTGPVYIDCYKLDGTKLWTVNLGRNIRAGAHYTQMAVFDFDGDGKSEMVLKTSDGTVDGRGMVIGDANADYRNSSGYVLEGNEYLTLFDGATGAALDTIEYIPVRGSVSSWGDNYGNRVDRFLSCVAYLNGETPSVIMCRGYYTRAVIVAYDVVDKKLKHKWTCDSNDTGKASLAGQGAHYATSADVDQDGFDEIVYGSAVIDHDGSLLYTLSGANNGAGGGHGDAVHVGDFDLNNPGLEIFMVHEAYPNAAGIEMHDAATGKYLYNVATNTDVGRGAAADIDPRYDGAEAWATGTDAWNSPLGYLFAAGGEVITNTIPAANFVIWWDGDLGREILDHKFSKSTGAGTPVIYKWNYENDKSDVIKEFSGTYSNNYTKGNPCIQADIFGDWREELVLRTTDSSALRIYTTTEYTETRIYTLMHDKQYRCQAASQNVAYNQPPHTGFYIGFAKDLMEIPVKSVKLVP